MNIKFRYEVQIAILAILCLLSSIASAQECALNGDYHVYYGNGVNTSFVGAVDGMVRAKNLIGNEYRGRNIRWKVAFNATGYGGFQDAIESINQFAAQAIPSEAWQQQFSTDSIRIDNNNHVNDYKSSLDDGNAVLTVAHSQGNWFALRAFSQLKDVRENGIGVYHVSSPAAMVAGGGQPGDRERYLINNLDIINNVPGSLSPNITLSQVVDIAEPIDDTFMQRVLGVVIPDNWEESKRQFLRALWGHYFSTYTDSRFSLAEALKDGVLASLDKLVFPVVGPNCAEREWFHIGRSLSIDDLPGLVSQPACETFLVRGQYICDFGYAAYLPVYGTSDGRCIITRSKFIRVDEIILDSQIAVENPYIEIEPTTLSIEMSTTLCNGSSRTESYETPSEYFVDFPVSTE